MTTRSKKHRAAITQLLVLLLIALGTPACSKDPAKAKKEYFDSGSKYFSGNKYREAVIQFRNAVAVDPRYAEAHYQLGLCYSKLSQFPQAYQEFVKTTDLNTGHLDAHLKQGGLLLMSGKFNESKAKAELVLQKDS